MSAPNKKYIIVGPAIFFIGAGIFLFTRGDEKTVASPSGSLYPEQAISHGHGLAVDAKDSSKLYVATHYGLFVLVNEKELYRIGKNKDDYMGFSPHPTDPNIFFTSGHSGSAGNLGFQKSEDGGVTWGKVSNGVNGPVDFHAMAVSPVNPDLIYGWYQGNLQRSTDQGKTWEIVNRGLRTGYLAADPQDESTVYAATPEGIAVSKNKGAIWTTLSPELAGGAVSVVAIQPNNENVLLAFAQSLGGLGKSIDGGKTWEKVSERFGGETLYHLTFDKNQPETAYALTDKSSLYKSANGGVTWIKIR
jgi:hypothetical protein